MTVAVRNVFKRATINSYVNVPSLLCRKVRRMNNKALQRSNLLLVRHQASGHKIMISFHITSCDTSNNESRTKNRERKHYPNPLSIIPLEYVLTMKLRRMQVPSESDCWTMLFNRSDEAEDYRFRRLSELVQQHKEYLKSIGLGERGKSIGVSRFVSAAFDEGVDDSNNNRNNTTTDLNNIFEHAKTEIPEVVSNFNPHEKNTLITTDPDYTEGNKMEDLQQVLDIRLHPLLRGFLQTFQTEVFLGTSKEMVAFYYSKKKGCKINYEFTLPSSAKYFLAEAADGMPFVILTGLVSHENMVAQLLTLKLGNIDATKNIKIIGDPCHFNDLVLEDIDEALKQIPTLTAEGQYNNVLVVAGCGKEQDVCDILLKNYTENVGVQKRYDGHIVSFSYLKLQRMYGQNQGVIVLNLPYGEIAGEVVSQLISKARCRDVFTGGAGGYIPAKDSTYRPTIGEYIPIKTCMHYDNRTVASLDPKARAKNERVHMQVPSIFLETYNWLDRSREVGNGVDVETFYIVKAIEKYNNKSEDGDSVRGRIGYFVSDMVGEKPLRTYDEVYTRYEDVLLSFFKDSCFFPKKKAVSFTSEFELERRITGNPIRMTAQPLQLDPKMLQSPVMKTGQEVFDMRRLSERNRVPVQISKKEYKPPQIPETIARGVVQMPIKSAGSEELVLPPCFSTLKEIIQDIFNFESAFNPNVKDWYAYLTVDKGPVEAGETQRNPGVHTDGFQGAGNHNRANRVPIASTYVYFSAIPTIATTQAFNLEFVNEERENVFSHLQKQWDPKQSVEMTPGYVHRMDAYTVHRAGNAMERVGRGQRVFVRVKFFHDIVTRRGNYVNPYLSIRDKSQRTLDPFDLTCVTDFETSQEFLNLYELYSEYDSPQANRYLQILLDKLEKKPDGLQRCCKDMIEETV